MRKKAEIEIEKLVAFAIALVVFGVVVYGFINLWGDGEDTAGDMMDNDQGDCDDGEFEHPVTGECMIFLLFNPKWYSILRRRWRI
ncbi:MAG: hypothetical protein ACLFNK_00555 [Candidatus Woesearchaeota archaeon]